jgi:hypothetical protein
MRYKIAFIILGIGLFFFLIKQDYINQYLYYKKLPTKTNNNIYDRNIPDTILLNQLRFPSTHNSYHKQAGHLKLMIAKLFAPNEVEGLKYSHPPLYQQLEEGIRSFEFDVRYVNGSFVNMHVPIVDNSSNSPDVALAFKEVKQWSDNHPLHIPIIIMVELSREWCKYYLVQKKWNEDLCLKFDDVVFNKFKNNLITPNNLKNGYPDLKEVRGKIAVVFMADFDIIGLFGVKYNNNRKATHIMVDGKHPDKSITLFVKRDDPFASDIDSLVKSGFIVRTRADAGLVKDKKKKNRALNSLAQIVSTDFPKVINGYKQYSEDDLMQY